jgi:integrase
MLVHEIDTALVVRILRPLWAEKLETGKRTQLRICRVIEYARSHGYSDKVNPATWSILKHILPAPGNKPKRMEAMPFAEVPAYMQVLAGCDRIQAQALRFLILTASRTEEVIGARWEEIDLEDAVWDIPAERMKGDRRHRVPLSVEAVMLLKSIERRGEYVFSHTDGLTPMGLDALRLELRETHENVDVHGFRASFKSWAEEHTWMPSPVIEMSLAHKIKDKTEEAYWRTDILAKRALLMTMWANHCTRRDAGAEVIALKRPELVEVIG